LECLALKTVSHLKDAVSLLPTFLSHALSRGTVRQTLLMVQQVLQMQPAFDGHANKPSLMALLHRRLPRYRTPPILQRSAQGRCWVGADYMTGAMVAVPSLWSGQGPLMPGQQAYDRHHKQKLRVAWVLPFGCASAAAWRSTISPWIFWRCSTMHVPPRVRVLKTRLLLTEACPSLFPPSPQMQHDGQLCVGVQKPVWGYLRCRPRCFGDALDPESQTHLCVPLRFCT